MRKLIAGNWKMNGASTALAEIETIAAGLEGRADALVCPPATLLSRAAERVRGSALMLGGQDCHDKPSGAFTGEIAAEMLEDAGASHVIVGHSERRSLFGETDATVRAKAEAAFRAGLVPIVCVGETEAERDAGRAEAVVERQLASSLPDGANADRLVVAYEPVWAIGTGRTPTEADIAAIHAHIRRLLVRRFGEAGAGMRVLYGGSVKPDNAAAILRLENVDGALVGGASLKARDFLGILAAAPG